MLFDPLAWAPALLAQLTCVRCAARSAAWLCPGCALAGPLRGTTASGLPVIGLGPHEGHLPSLIHELKYRAGTRWGSRLGRSLAVLLPPSDWPECLVPLPLHPERLAERGYNQAALLARGVAAGLAPRHRTAIDFDSLTRVKETRRQADLERSARRENALGAFSAEPRKASRPRHVHLVDDVVTTGATLDSAKNALELAGFRVIGALVVSIADRRPTADRG